ncbi:hypothetical protein MNBD_ALPHA12-1079 [hydrothermal vent metagenome]|uniref:Carbohydrate kinase PfkB domain-containing protein n=1 Tax=hydrothermal vent metagenome TaxID=652676 RepID=A0A3B0U0F1_9ZZZZ
MAKDEPGAVFLVGDVMKDIIVLPKGEMRRGSDQAAKIRTRSGGAAANQAVWLAAFGVSARLAARVGAAEQSQLSAGFKARGVTAYLAADKELETGMLISLVAPDGERSFFTDRGANEALCQNDIVQEALENIELVLLSGYSFFSASPRRVVRDLMGWAKEKNIPVAIDPASSGFLSDVGVKNFIEWTSGAAMLFPNEDEAKLLSGEKEINEQLRVLGRSFDLVIIKRGALGASAINHKGEIVCVSAPKVDVVDTTGAGDAFAAGFLCAYMAKKDIRAALLSGVGAGSKAVGHVGAQPAN